MKYSISFLMILNILLGFFSSSMLLCFSLALTNYKNNIHGIVIGFLNTIITLCSIIFQPITGYFLNKIYMLNYKTNLNENNFQFVFFILPICLIISLTIQYFIKENK